MRGYTRLAVIALTWLVIVPSTAYAQASIAGVVKDTSGAVLPGVTVEAASPVLIEKVRSVVTDGNGLYRIVDLRPGLYTVTFSLAGFNIVKREGIELAGAFVASVNGELKVGSLEETITVSGEAPTVDIQSTTRQRVLDHAVIDAIPTGRIHYGLAALIPGVTAAPLSGIADVGGSQGNQGVEILVHGSKGDATRITQNGISLGALGSGGQNRVSMPNMGAVQEMTIDYAAVSAEMATGGVRVNLIPREGGNTFKGSAFASFMNHSMQGNNFSQDLEDRGLSTPDTIKKNWDINPGFGGRIVRDRLWFYATVRYNGAQNYVGGLFENRNANNPNAWTFDPDPSRPVSNEITWEDAQVRLTWQANPTNKFAVTYQRPHRISLPEGASAAVAREAANFREFKSMRAVQGDWTSPITNRLLFEAVGILRTERVLSGPPPDVNPLMIAVTDQASGLTYRTRATSGNGWSKLFNYRAAASYITGAHAFKVGYNNGLGTSPSDTTANQPVSYRFNNGVPNQITVRATPFQTTFHQDADLGLYAQDKWTIDRLTATLGVRYDYYKNSFPEVSLGPGLLVPGRNLTLPETPGVAWKDVTPKLGASYNLFGNGKTALKVSLNKYLAGAATGGDFGQSLGPTARLVTQTTRSWNDANRNFSPDCNLTLPTANGECGAMTAANFGATQAGTTYDPDTLTGWAKRSSNWEFSAGVLHEILPRVSVDVGYFRRWYGNFTVTDNLAVAPSDYTTFNLPAPASNAALPNAGSLITGLFDLNPAKVGASSNYITFADKYGKQIEHWNGVDVNMNARPRAGVLLAGGFSTGRTVTDNCAVVSQLPEMLFGQLTANSVLATTSTLTNWTPLQYCHQQTPFLTQFKLIGSYTVPTVDVQISGTFQSLPGPAIAALYNAPNAVVAPLLGRSLSGNAANITVNVVPPGSLYGERLDQLDVRFGKILKFGATRSVLNVDLYNVLNGNTVLQENSNFALWRRPQTILTARFVKFGVQFDF